MCFLINLFSAVRQSFAECNTGLYFFLAFFLGGGGVFLISLQSLLGGAMYSLQEKKRERYFLENTDFAFRHRLEVRSVFWLIPGQLHVGLLCWATEAFISS